MNKQIIVAGIASVSSMSVKRLAQTGQYDNDRTWDKDPQYFKENQYQERDPTLSWGMGNGQGSEKQDAIWHAGHNTATSEKFDSTIANNANGMTAGNYAEPEPSTRYYTGNYVQRHPIFAQRDMGQPVDQDVRVFKWWTDGQGAGSEKQDAFWDIAHQASSSAQFDKDAAYFPGISSNNGEDAAPANKYFSSQQMGFLAQGPPAPEGQYQWRKSVYPTRGMGQPFPNIESHEGAGAPIFKQWTNGNGLGSEKEDFVKDIERNSEGDTAKFHKDTAYFPGVAAYSGHDTEPSIDHYWGGPEAAGSLAQAYGPPAPEGQYQWRKSVYPTRGMGQPFPNIQSQEGAGAPIFKQWTNGNGLGSEKHDFVNDIAWNSGGDEAKFHKDTAYFPGVAAYSGHDTAPVDEWSVGGPQAAGN